MSRKIQMVLTALPFLVIVAIFIPRYGIDSIVSIPIATGLVYGVIYLARAAIMTAIELGRRDGS